MGHTHDRTVITTCHGNGITSPVVSDMGLTEDNAATLLLPETKEWYLDGSLEDSLTFTPHEGGSICQMHMKIRRNMTVYLVKNLMLTVLLVLGSLLTTLFLHPEDMVGDRTNVLFIAFLILITNMQTDLGLGRHLPAVASVNATTCKADRLLRQALP